MSNSIIVKEDARRKIERIGETFVNFQGAEFTIVEYINATKVTVEFKNGYRRKTSYKECLGGSVKNPYIPIIYGVGYIGEGKYKAKRSGTGRKPYETWQGMIERCYDDKFHKKRPTYEECEVCKEWHNYQNFAKWYEDNYYKVGDETMCLDKDILIKGNKIYSPETCVFAPNEINVLFTKSDRARGDYPVGVYYKKQNKKFCSQCKIGGGKPQKYLGLYDTVEEAFQAYKIFKEQYIKEVADRYKELIPNKLYEALYKYEVDIND